MGKSGGPGLHDNLSPLIRGGGFVVSLADSVRPVFFMFNALAIWRIAFVLVGLPGPLLAAALRLSVREPGRRATPAAYSDDRPYTVRESASFIWVKHSERCRISPKRMKMPGGMPYSVVVWRD